MAIGNERGGVDQRIVAPPPTWRGSGEAGGQWSTPWNTKDELSALDRFDILGWDEV